MKYFLQIEKAVNRLHYLDLKTATHLIKLNLTGMFVPSKQLCQWLLIKFQSNGKLLQRIIECCDYSFLRLNHRLHTGHNWIEIIVAISMVSRIR